MISRIAGIFRAGSKWLKLLFALLIVLQLVWLGTVKWPEVAFIQLDLEEPQKSQSEVPASFVVGTYNIHSGKGIDGQRSIERISDVLSANQADFVAINEARDNWLGEPEQAQKLAELLDTSWVYAPAMRKFFSGSFGNAFLSRYDIERVWVVPLVSEYRSAEGVETSSHRNLISVELDVLGTSVMILATHLDRGEVRLMQLQQVLEEFQRYSHVILLGDLNSIAADPPLESILSQKDTSDMIYGGEPHEPHIDWILTKGFSLEEHGSHPVGASDHPYYWARLRLNNDN